MLTRVLSAAANLLVFYSRRSLLEQRETSVLLGCLTTQGVPLFVELFLPARRRSSDSADGR